MIEEYVNLPDSYISLRYISRMVSYDLLQTFEMWLNCQCKYVKFEQYKKQRERQTERQREREREREKICIRSSGLVP